MASRQHLSLTIAFLAVALAGLPGEVSAQRLPLQLEQKSIQKVRSSAPTPIDFELTWNGSGILKGRLALEVREGNSLFSSIVSAPLVINGGENQVRMMLPTAQGLTDSDSIELRVRFLNDETNREVDLGTRPIRIAETDERLFRVLFCDQFSFQLDPDLAAALQSFHLEKYWRPLFFDSSQLNIRGINRLSKRTPAQQDPSDKLLQTLIGKPDRFSTTTDRIEPADMPVDPHWYCSVNIVLITQSAFARLRTQQLTALSEWVRAGGSLLVEPLGVLEDRHIEFLNGLSAERKTGPFLAGVEGRLELPKESSFETFQAGLGHVAVLHQALDGKQTPSSRSWKEMVSFLWKLRKSQRSSIKSVGHFRLGDVSPADLLSIAPPQLPPNFNSMTPQKRIAAQQNFNRQVQRYQQMIQQQQWIIQQQQMRGFVNMSGRVFRSTQNMGQGDLAFQPIQSGDSFLKKLIPDEVEIVPLEYIAGILVLYVLAIGPGEYFVLGLLRLRRFTWITFPLLTVGFTFFTIWLSNEYLSSSVERTHATVIDVDTDGSALRENRFELLYTASTHDVVTEIDRGLFTPITHTRFGNDQMLQQQDITMLRGELIEPTQAQASPGTIGPPMLEGKPPGIHQAFQNVPQWTPQINRIFRIAPQDEEIASDLEVFDWSRPWNIRTDGVQIQQQVRQSFGNEAEAIGFAGNEIVFGNLDQFFAPTQMMTLQGQAVSRNFLTDISVRQRLNLFEVVSRIAPHGGDNFEDLTLLDVTDESESLLIIVVPEKDGLRIYRRLYRNNVSED